MDFFALTNFLCFHLTLTGWCTLKVLTCSTAYHMIFQKNGVIELRIKASWTILYLILKIIVLVLVLVVKLQYLHDIKAEALVILCALQVTKNVSYNHYNTNACIAEDINANWCYGLDLSTCSLIFTATGPPWLTPNNISIQ